MWNRFYFSAQFYLKCHCTSCKPHCYFLKLIFRNMWCVFKGRNMQADSEQFQNFWKKPPKCAWQIKELSLNDHCFSSHLAHRNFSQMKLCPSLTGEKQQYFLLIQQNSVVNASMARYTYCIEDRRIKNCQEDPPLVV